MAKDKHPCLVFCQSTHKRQSESEEKLMMIKTKNQMTLIAKIYSLKIAQKNLNIHVMIHYI